MYDPVMKLDPAGIPLLSGRRLEAIAERFVSDFGARCTAAPGLAFARAFAQQYLHLTLEYRWLSHNGCLLGATVFADDTLVPVYVPEKDAAEMVIAEKDRVFLDSSLLPESQRHRCCFTLMHECAHRILHANHYRRLSGRNMPAVAECRAATVGNGSIAPPASRSGSDWMEWQANRLASALLMPQSQVRDWSAREDMRGYYEHRVDSGMPESRARRMAHAAMAIRFSVSEQAAEVRLRSLGLDSGWKGPFRP